MADVRIKLHANINSNVQNIWMSLNYDKKPTIGHIMGQLKKNFNLNEDYDNESGSSSINLFLDEYWLPPWENSRLLRENDCIRVEFVEQSEKQNNLNSLKSSKSCDLNNYCEPLKPHSMATNTSNNNLIKTNDLNLKTFLNKSNSQTTSTNNLNIEKQNVKNNTNKLDKNLFKEAIKQQKNQTTSSSSSSTSSTSTTTSDSSSSTSTTSSPSASSTASSTAFKKNKNNKNTNKKPNNNNKASFAGNKKFSVANYVHLLNEPVNRNDDKISTVLASKNAQEKKKKQNSHQYWDDEEEEEEDNQYEANDEPEEVYKKASKSGSFNNNIERIAQSINSTAKSKWKNSNNTKAPATTTTTTVNGATIQRQHIIFDSSDDSSSDSSDDENNESKKNKQESPVKNNKPKQNDNQKAKQQQKQQQPQQQRQQKQQATTSPKQQQQKTNNWKPKTKEEQLNIVNYNRSFVVENPKTLNEFKKVFDQTKLNAPVDYGYDVEPSQSKPIKNSSDENKHKPKVNYEKYEPLVGIPNINDKIAFQILEISSNFTPEISDYKTGVVIAFDEQTSEVTLKLNESYNEVLSKPNKFTVFEEEHENSSEDGNTSTSSSSSDESERKLSEEDDILKTDWKSLINVKLIEKIPSPKEENKQHSHENQTQEPKISETSNLTKSAVETVQEKVQTKEDETTTTTTMTTTETATATTSQENVPVTIEQHQEQH